MCRPGIIIHSVVVIFFTLDTILDQKNRRIAFTRWIKQMNWLHYVLFYCLYINKYNQLLYVQICVISIEHHLIRLFFLLCKCSFKLNSKNWIYLNYLNNWEITNRDNRKFNTINPIKIYKNTFFFIFPLLDIMVLQI